MALPAGFPPPVAKSAKAPKTVLPAPDMAEAPALEIPSLPAAIPSAPAVTGLPGAVGVPSGGAFGELGQLPAAGNISPLTIVLALVAVGGGGAAWKFYSQRSREKHEEQMLKIEKGDSGNDQQRQKCDAAAQWAKDRVENLAARAEASDKNLAAIADSIDKRIGAMEQKLTDLDSVESRLSVLERKAGAEKKPQKPKGGAK